MSYPTQRAFIHVGTFDEETRAHPCMKWMENYTKTVVDKQRFSEPAETLGHTAAFVLQKSTGETVEGADAAWKALAEVYAPFASYVHDPVFLCMWETETGYGMIGVAVVWWKLVKAGEEAGVKGYGGEEWDGVTPGAFKFEYVRDEKEEFKLSRSEIYSDPSAAMVTMMKRGMLKPEDLVNM